MALKKSKIAKASPRMRAVRGGQRQRLIDACISALHIYGPSRTTVEKVVAIAKMSPGIVRFYFKSKAAMLVAALQFLAAEFEDQVLTPVGRLKSTPVAALELLVALYLDPEIASPRKVSVWYAFWGEASSRQEYYDICGQKDESFAALVRELIERLIRETGRTHLDPDGIALGLIGALEILWQDFAFKSETEIDRAAALSRCHAFLNSVFPGSFSGVAPPVARAGSQALHFSPWIYENRRLFILEREQVFNPAWQFVAHRAQLTTPGDFVAVDLGNERALVVRDEDGVLRAFRNSCSESPHVLIVRRQGTLMAIECPVHGVAFALDGTRRGGRGSADLCAFDVRRVGDLIMVRASRGAPVDEWTDLDGLSGARMVAVKERAVAADWKLIVEGWLEALSPRVLGWSEQRYQRIVGEQRLETELQRFIAPNHWLGVMRDGYSVTQVLPTAPGQSVCRESSYTWCDDDRAAAAARYLAARLWMKGRAAALDMAASTQQGMLNFGDRTAVAVQVSPRLAAFRQRLADRIPAMQATAPPVDW